MKRLKICLACSVGGHLEQIMKLHNFYERHDYYFLTFYRKFIHNLVKKEKVYFLKDPSRNPIAMFINIFQSFLVFLREKPDVIISTGAGVAVPTCYIGWFFRKKVIFIEDWCVVDKPSLSGRLVYPIAHLFLVQWKQLLKYYTKAVYKGSLV